ncbi:TfoX/Sxy family protein [Azospirillum sp.]|uniref:TfoX/Sxy family protein n=1 Tax=Azospirillum sp. TaxID=34012 RepID=UPI002D6DE227|nr:TfoX/Sxy family protein [Azospirillum sp.]HYF85971.1 TfoX/Sxy family protein [Azospirillum sp.]
MPAQPPSEYVATLCEMMASLGDVRARRMFGGYGLSIDGLTFALVADETLYFKADDVNRSAFAELGLEPFRPMPDKPTPPCPTTRRPTRPWTTATNCCPGHGPGSGRLCGPPRRRRRRRGGRRKPSPL